MEKCYRNSLIIIIILLLLYVGICMWVCVVQTMHGSQADTQHGRNPDGQTTSACASSWSPANSLRSVFLFDRLL